MRIASSIVHREVGSGDSVTFCIWMECEIMVYHMQINRHILTSLKVYKCCSCWFVRIWSPASCLPVPSIAAAISPSCRGVPCDNWYWVMWLDCQADGQLIFFYGWWQWVIAYSLPHRIVAFNVILGCESVALGTSGTKPIVCGFVQWGDVVHKYWWTTWQFFPCILYTIVCC